MTEEPKPPIETPAEQEESSRPIHGGRNLMILGFAALLITIATTAISLIVYRATGDIYLDRSRPGYISDSESNDGNYEAKEKFSADGEITSDAIDEYLKQLDSIRGRIDSLSNTFDEDQLIDDALGIYPHEETSNEE